MTGVVILLVKLKEFC